MTITIESGSNKALRAKVFELSATVSIVEVRGLDGHKNKKYRLKDEVVSFKVHI
jgi:hypothetical protein